MIYSELVKQLELLKSPSSDAIKIWCEKNISKAGDVLSIPNEHGMTPLHRAAIEGDVPVISFLLSLGADASRHNIQLQTPLFSALMLPMVYKEGLKENKMVCFRELMLRAPHTLSQKDRSGDTVLQHMAIHGFIPLINELLAIAPEIALIPNNRSEYPIHTAILNQQAECVSILLQHKDAEKLSDIKGRTPLHYAACFGNEELVMRCCDLVKNINPRDNSEVTPLMLAAESGRIDTVNALIQRGADPLLVDAYGMGILEYAQGSKHEEVVSWIHEHIHGLAPRHGSSR